MFVSVWAILVALYILCVPRIRNGKFAPHAAIIGLEIPTIIFWFIAFVALALFTIEIEPICILGDEFPVVKAIIKTCVIMKTASALAALSWFVAILLHYLAFQNGCSNFFRFLWLVTCVTTGVQACRSRKKQAKACAALQVMEAGPPAQSTSVKDNGYKANQGASVTTVEMLPQSRYNNW